MEGSRGNPDTTHERSSSSRFRFKRKHDHTDDISRSRHRHHHDRHHRSKRRNTSTHSSNDPSVHDHSINHLAPDDAFRESLFDALADDEGAAFWEGVYGQPMHQYPDTYADPETGLLNQMDEEEYAQFVRKRMWERSREGIEAAREEKRRERAREKKRRDDVEAAEEQQRRERARTKARRTGDQDQRVPEYQEGSHIDFVHDGELEDILSRGRRRKERKRWQAIWQNYLQSRERTHDTPGHDGHERPAPNFHIIWPVESGKPQDIAPGNIEHFFKQVAVSVDHGSDQHSFLSSSLKSERVQWHPDKVQQRYGSGGLDSQTVQYVTATFQIIDRLWNEIRNSK